MWLWLSLALWMPGAPPMDATHQAPKPPPIVAQLSAAFYDVAQGKLQVEERWGFESIRPIPPGQLIIEAPPGAVEVQTDKEGIGFQLQKQRLVNESPLGPGRFEAILRYHMPIVSSQVSWHRRPPVPMSQSRALILDIPGLEIDVLPTGDDPFVRTISQKPYRIYQFGMIGLRDPSEALEFQFDSLPEPSRWPLRLTSLSLILIFLGTIYGLSRGAKGPAGHDRVAADLAFKEARILEAIRQLEAAKAAETVTEARYTRRKRLLIDKLSQVLAAKARQESNP